MKKIVGTEVTIFVYNAAGLLVEEYSTTIASTQDAQVSYLTTDHLGSPRTITDENGAVTNRKDFTAFGETVTSSERVGGSNGNGYDDPQAVIRQDYTGYQKDDESGLEFAQARYYNTGHGRFTSVDPLTASADAADPQSFNRYAYVGNDPLNFVDPSGLEMCSAEYSFSQCGGSGAFWGGGSFGDRVAQDASIYEGIPQHAQEGNNLYLERLSNASQGFGYITAAQLQQVQATFWIWYDAYNESEPQSANPRFSLGATFSYSELSGSSGGLNNRGRALIQEMGRWGPVLQRTTTVMGAGALIIVTAPLVADAAVAYGAAVAQSQLVNAMGTMTRGQIFRTYIGSSQRELISILFRTGRIPAGLSRTAVLAYIEIAKKAIAEGIDKGTQARRLEQLMDFQENEIVTI